MAKPRKAVQKKTQSKNLPKSRIVFKEEAPKIGDRVAAVDARTKAVIYLGKLTKIGIATSYWSQGGRLIPSKETYIPNRKLVKIVKIGLK